MRICGGEGTERKWNGERKINFAMLIAVGKDLLIKGTAWIISSTMRGWKLYYFQLFTFTQFFLLLLLLLLWAQLVRILHVDELTSQHNEMKVGIIEKELLWNRAKLKRKCWYVGRGNKKYKPEHKNHIKPLIVNVNLSHSSCHSIIWNNIVSVTSE
jgi:hypothetical protein